MFKLFSKSLVPNGASIIGKSHVQRLTGFNRSLQSFRSYSSNSTSKNGRGKILFVLGLLAVGSTVAAASFTKKDPVAALEPHKNPKPKAVFKDGEIDVVFVLGGPGSGKGTQSEKLVNDYSFVHLAAGDLLRAEQKRPDSEYGELIARYIKEGLIVPQEVTLKLLENAIIENNKKGKTRFLIDGFPRKMDQAISFEEQIAKSSLVLFFECPESVMIERILQRGKTSGRSDDNVESLKKRFKTFHETSMPVVDYFEKQGKVVKLNCNNTVQKVHQDVKQALQDKLNVK